MIKTNRLYDTYFLLHQSLTDVSLGKAETVFEQGLVTDKGAIYLKICPDEYTLDGNIVTGGTPTQFEYLANVFDVFYPLDRKKPWSVCYPEAIIRGLFFRSLVGLRRFFQMIYDASVVDDTHTFFVQNWVDTYTESQLLDFDPQELAAGFKFYTLRGELDTHKYKTDLSPMIDITFTKNAYKTLSPHWLQDHIIHKYGSLEEARSVCREYYPDLFTFAETLK